MTWEAISSECDALISVMKTNLAKNIQDYFALLKQQDCFDGNSSDYLYLVWCRFCAYYGDISLSAMQTVIDGLLIDP